MTSILEALRELEEERRRARGDRTVSVADAPADPPSSSSLLYPLIAGLAVGILVVGLALWWSGIGAAPTEVVPSLPADRHDVAAPAAPTTKGPGAAGLAWLERADAPLARVERHAAPARSSEPTPPRPASPAHTPASRGGRVTVESIRYTTTPERRSVTLRLDGRRVTLRQGERAGGIEVQLILEDGAYLNRGSDVIFVVPDG